MLDNISLFVAVVQAGSLKAASESLQIPSSTVSRRIKALEDALGCKLLSRNSHYFELTREGSQLFEKASFHVNAMEAITDELQSDISGDKGHIKVLAPTNLVATCLQPYFSRYLKQYPAIELELELSNSLKHFYSENADFAIRVGKQPDSDLTQLKLGQIETLLVASPAYLASHGVVEQPRQLADRDLIISRPLAQWELLLRADTQHRALVKSRQRRVQVNDIQVAKQFVVDGLGITLLPKTEVVRELRDQQLVQVLPDWRGEKRDVYAVWYRRQLLSTRAARLIDYLKQQVMF
ncbi:LysR family transcriptional regulator [Photobacterium sp. TY1-4]|uniref:LysR family transcriptional regulator n=1 Tax=Photobacterium sp. TY1-4 TaxID=2899122 RepID=UPI0021C1460F|nr:LysR family transcriptional regulator [Photobacterium sp. TY1-4]UXI03386.1 LysR family transcriptional regulator [Photobacterium sp. TY1-4]